MGTPTGRKQYRSAASRFTPVRTVLAIALLVGLFVIAQRNFGVGNAASSVPHVTGPRDTGIVVPSWEHDGYASAELSQTLGTLRRIGLRRVTFVVTWYQQSLTASTFGPASSTPSDEALSSAIAAAREQGFKVVLKPHVDLPDDTWRGDIDPADRAAWFEQYHRFLNRYAEFAQGRGVSSLVVGTELATLSGDPRWNQVIADARARFAGTLTYAANWDEADHVRFWNLLDEIGIDAYYPLTTNTSGSISVRELTKGWDSPKQTMRHLATRWRKPVRFTEVGYTRHRGTTAAPWDFALASPAASAEQAAAYRALFRALQPETWFLGADLWATDPPAEEHDELGYSPIGHLAERELQAGAAAMLRSNVSPTSSASP